MNKKRAFPLEKWCLPLYAITPFTMQDFPGRLACILWFSGCNMRCDYCHNPDIVRQKGKIPIIETLSFLKSRNHLLDGVVLSGGEASLYPDIIPFAQKIKAMGYDIKIDTNGTKPEHIKTLHKKNLIDYVALDYKAPKDKFNATTHCKLPFDNFKKSLYFLCSHQSSIPLEIRTTVHTSFLNEDDISQIIKHLDKYNFHGTYYLQHAQTNQPNKQPTLGNIMPQKRVLNVSTLPKPKNFKIKTRYFPSEH